MTRVLSNSADAVANRKWYAANRERRIATTRLWARANVERKARADRIRTATDPVRRAFFSQRARAAIRNIAFCFSFEDWVMWWEPDMHRRGRGADDLCMARHGDSGPYCTGNVSKITNAQNTKERLCRAS